MCGRYGFVPGEDFYNRFKVKNRLESLSAHYNITPGMNVPVVVRQSPNEVKMMRWGLVPFWAKDPKIGYKMINARAEGIESKPSFRKPLREQRCLVLTSGFYEWKKMDKDKVPFYIRLKDKKSFAFAGLFDIWKDAEGHPLYSFTIITTIPNKLVMDIHDRMPVILPENSEEVWLDKKVSDLNIILKLLKPYDEGEMEAYPVSKLVNNSQNDGESVIQPTK